tara:strand:- start:131 stop:376 length:246 start_codon:yes stop_codon:yes gene_type:complete
MALKQTFEYGGLSIKDGYLRIIHINGNKEKIKLTLGYQSKANQVPLKKEDYEFTPNMDSNFLAQGYTYLKTLETFNASADC